MVGGIGMSFEGLTGGGWGDNGKLGIYFTNKGYC